MTDAAADDIEAIDPSFRIELPNFEGPLDLLLHLIRKHELDVLDLPVAFVTNAYVEYLGLMEQLNLDVAGEYLVMAATLAHIKSKMLLPNEPDDEDDEEVEEGDPRAELIRRLLEYQKYKRAAESLGGRGVVGRDVFTRGAQVESAAGPAELAEASVFQLIDAFARLAKRRDQRLALEVTAEGITVNERMVELTERLRERRRCTLDALLDAGAGTYGLVVTFLALLEMTKMRLLRLYQASFDAPLVLEYRVLDAGDGDGEVQADSPTAPRDAAPAPKPTHGGPT
ncbi:MAG: segregation/condensation protein A [Myxococcales bacterium]|nr:segregation/condensation protein A [Myxococcales bacterium]